MTKKRRTATKGRPPSMEELSGILKARPYAGKPIVCNECKQPGYTLVKSGENKYKHQTWDMCIKAQLRAKEKESGG